MLKGLTFMRLESMAHCRAPPGVQGERGLGREGSRIVGRDVIRERGVIREGGEREVERWEGRVKVGFDGRGKENEMDKQSVKRGEMDILEKRQSESEESRE